ncbi:Flp family type IVb pilin [Phreatobacter oligotrophus]|uniref:Pilus assembly protein Flp/PilA n=1 Tax=Phreatobacter oligotrophus TaxID=1122261 RepID=A0A2T4YYE2_9HYPH|nr:Flp family type IVb pilin [Phreatobacter oligotrophus]PTM51767.1 pilus assembly protein Flp/PilA [Phreatobacter oligotrophus]
MARTLRRMTEQARRFASDRSGATAIEYALVASGIAGVIILIVYALGDSVQNNLYARIASAFN